MGLRANAADVLPELAARRFTPDVVTEESPGCQLPSTDIGCVLSCLHASAHDIPFDVNIRAFLKPEGRRLRVLVRVPLQAMRDVQVPYRGPNLVDLTRIEPLAP